MGWKQYKGGMFINEYGKNAQKLTRKRVQMKQK